MQHWVGDGLQKMKYFILETQCKQQIRTYFLFLFCEGLLFSLSRVSVTRYPHKDVFSAFKSISYKLLLQIRSMVSKVGTGLPERVLGLG